VSVFAVLAVLLAAVLFKLVDLQLIDPDAYQAMSEKQRMFEHVIPAERGAIVDRSGVELAVSVPQDSVYIDPGMVEDPAATAAAVAPIHRAWWTLRLPRSPRTRRDGRTDQRARTPRGGHRFRTQAVPPEW
jgi:cell division protein FtsI (penicillin-binding protein 3)